MMILAFPDSLPQAQALARQLQVPCETIGIHRFPDQESLLQLPARLPEQVILYRSLDHPNAKLVELLLATETARRLGGQRIILVAPYLCYMRQDTEFVPGQAVSQHVIGRFLAAHCDAVITVDPHLHRVTDLRAAVPARQAVALTAAPLIGRFIASHCERPLLLGPDQESEQWVRQAAGEISADHLVARKVRSGDTRVQVQLPDHDYRGRHLVLVDDMVSTGHTLMACAALLREQGVAHLDAACTHALFDEETSLALQQAGIERIWSCDSIAHPTNRIAMVELLATAVRGLQGNKSGRS